MQREGEFLGRFSSAAGDLFSYDAAAFVCLRTRQVWYSMRFASFEACLTKPSGMMHSAVPEPHLLFNAVRYNMRADLAASLNSDSAKIDYFQLHSLSRYEISYWCLDSER